MFFRAQFLDLCAGGCDGQVLDTIKTGVWKKGIVFGLGWYVDCGEASVSLELR